MIFGLHQKFALVLILLGLVGALWCFIDLRRHGSPSGGVRAFLILTWSLVLLQDGLGLALLAQGRRPSNFELHLTYGALSAAVLPLAWRLSARGQGRHEALYLGFGSLLFGLLTFRAAMVA
ncbi:MAG: hypothetical protein ACREN1_02985 [Candidatus Dormibacteria bacterium]